MTLPTGQPASKRAFSLLELILVLMLLALAAGLVAPSLTHFARGREALDAAADLLTLTRFAHDQAAQEGVPYRLNVDPQTHTYWLTVQRSSGGGAFERLAISIGRTFDLPARLAVSWESVGESDSQTHAYVQFDPDGSHEPATLRLTPPDGSGVQMIGQYASEPFRIREFRHGTEASL